MGCCFKRRPCAAAEREELETSAVHVVPTLRLEVASPHQHHGQENRQDDIILEQELQAHRTRELARLKCVLNLRFAGRSVARDRCMHGLEESPFLTHSPTESLAASLTHIPARSLAGTFVRPFLRCCCCCSKTPVRSLLLTVAPACSGRTELCSALAAHPSSS